MSGLSVHMFNWTAGEEAHKCLGTVIGEVALVMKCYGEVRCATCRTVPGSIYGGVTGDFFRGSFRQNHVP